MSSVLTPHILSKWFNNSFVNWICSCECTVFLFVEVNWNIYIAFKENDHVSMYLCITWLCFIMAKILIELLIISFNCVYSRSGVIEKMEALELENQEKMEVEESGRSGTRQGRSEHRRFHREVFVFGFYFFFFFQFNVQYHTRFAKTCEGWKNILWC